MYKAPKFELFTKKVVEIQFTGSIGVGAYLTLVSSLITFPFRILQLKMIFGEEANNLVQHGWFLSGNSGVSVTGVPSGDNIASKESPNPFFIGKNILRVININIEVKEGRQYIKLYTYNANSYVYNINCSIVIQEL